LDTINLLQTEGIGLPRLNYKFLGLLLLTVSIASQESHDHPAPEKLGTVSFPISCSASVQQEFNRGIALLHSFAYGPAESVFRAVGENDPRCAMTHWGVAMAQFHQLWEPRLSPVALEIGRQEIQLARALGAASDRERKLIEASALIFQPDAKTSYNSSSLRYEQAVCSLASQQSKDAETQIFCALSLLSNASPMDKSHAGQKRAAEILEPLYHVFPEHPGIAHYLIHAYDNAELAPRGLLVARTYAQIAPSAPHALHMPSHIFTRLGRWDDSIASNLAASQAAREQGDIGEELHAMDYLVYAYLQTARYPDAAEVISHLAQMSDLNCADFKVGYAATAMPARYAVEREEWLDAANIPIPKAAPHIVAIAVWARGLGLARTGRTTEAEVETSRLQDLEEQLRREGDTYWSEQVRILTLEVMAWTKQAEDKWPMAAQLMREAADREDALEKLPVTPGPIVPAREQLGYLLLQRHQPAVALGEFRRALELTPGRRGALLGAELCRVNPL
jgi:hypothetical protein